MALIEELPRREIVTEVKFYILLQHDDQFFEEQFYLELHGAELFLQDVHYKQKACMVERFIEVIFKDSIVI